MPKKSGNHYIHLSQQFIGSETTKQKYRMSEKDFIRNRKLTFSELSLCMMQLLRQNIQVELQRFFSIMKGGIYSYTSSAFVQSRKKLNPEMFYDLNRLVAEDFYQDNDETVELYKGHRLLSIDGSTVSLPVNADTKAVFGVFNNQKQTDDVVIARVSVLYDVLNDIVLDGRLCNFSTGEVSLSREHVRLARPTDIIVMDRAYPSFRSMYEMRENQVEFVYRCRHSFSAAVHRFYESGQREACISLRPSQHKSFKDLPYTKEETINVRMIRIDLPSGETELLMTSLLDTRKYPISDFKELYHQRWRVETYYDRFKNIISVESFSGTSSQFIEQEFNCALYMSNLQSILTKEAQQQANEKYEHRQYEYKINASLSLCFIRNRLVELFTSKKDDDTIMEELKTLFLTNVVPVRPNRSFPRKPDKYRQRTKPKQFSNRRIVL